MNLKLAPALLLAVVQIAPSTAFAPPSFISATTSSLRQYNEYYSQEGYHVDEYDNQSHPIYGEQNVDFSRRDTTGAFFRGLTAVGAVTAGSAVMRPWEANAAEFSDGVPAPTSAPPPVSSVPPEVPQTSAAKTTSTFSNFQFRTPARSTTTGSSAQYKNSLSEMDPTIVAAGAVTAAGLIGVTAAMDSIGDSNWAAQDNDKADAPASAAAAAASTAAPEKPKETVKQWYQPPTPYGIVNKDTNPFANKAVPVPATIAGAAPPLGAAPYGLAGGRNFWDNKVLMTAQSLPKPPPKKTPAPPTLPEVDTSKDKDKPWYQPPTPYGLVNKNKNPFLKDIQQYCEAGKVSEPCTDSIKGYLNDLSTTGEAASSDEAKTVVGYLDSIGGKTPAGASAAPSANVVKEALASGSNPPPASAEKVKEYLDALDIGKKPVITGMVMDAPPVTGTSPSFDAYDSRLTGIETRVGSLEERVDRLPDEVFDRMEEWRAAQENRWGSQYGSAGVSSGITSSGSGSGYVVPPPPSPPKKLRVSVTNAPRSTGMGGYLESLK